MIRWRLINYDYICKPNKQSFYVHGLEMNVDYILFFLMIAFFIFQFSAPLKNTHFEISMIMVVLKPESVHTSTFYS